MTAGHDDHAFPTAVRIFTCELETPPAPPWDQRKIALLEAVTGSPAPIESLILQLVRIGGWHPGHPGRYFAAYARRKDIRSGFSSRLDLGGRKVTLRFESPQAARIRFRGELVAMAVIIASLAVFGVCGWIAVQRQAVEAERVGELEAKASRDARVQRRQEAFAAQEAALTGSGFKGTSLSDALDDLTRASSHLAPGAQIQVVHWRPGVMSFETRGPLAPLSNQPMLRQSQHEPHQGVHLWGFQIARSGL